MVDSDISVNSGYRRNPGKEFLIAIVSFGVICGLYVLYKHIKQQQSNGVSESIFNDTIDIFAIIIILIIIFILVYYIVEINIFMAIGNFIGWIFMGLFNLIFSS